MNNFTHFDSSQVPSPCYVIDVDQLENNLALLNRVSQASGATILLALKAFSCFAVADLISTYLSGTAASGLYEARLGRTRFGGEVHAYVPGLKSDQVEEIAHYADCLIFNSLAQWHRLAHRVSAVKNTRKIELGLRINPDHSEVSNPLYDPCAPWSRLGSPADAVGPDDLAPFSGIHIHALCEQNFAPFDRLLTALENKASHLFPAIDWINLGGGVLLTADNFEIAQFIDRITDFRQRTGLSVHLEPGTAVVLNAGALVMEIIDCSDHIAIIDVSATCHMPDIIEANYTPDIVGIEALPSATALGHRGEECVVRLGGPTCLAGDNIGTYRFSTMPKSGDRLVMLDTAYYSMVKNTTFNGTALPAIALWYRQQDRIHIVKEFGYSDFENRLS